MEETAWTDRVRNDRVKSEWNGLHNKKADCTGHILRTNRILKHATEVFMFCWPCILVGISLDNDQLDAHLLYFTIRPLQSSTCFEHCMLIIRRLNCIDAASGIVLSVSGLPVHRTATDWQAATGWPYGNEMIPEIERGSTTSYYVDSCFGRGQTIEWMNSNNTSFAD